MSQTLRLPIQKYSYAANALSAHNPNIRWNHIGEEGMAIILGKSAPGFALNEISMQVVQKAGVLESIPLQKLCQQASDASRCGLIQDPLKLPIHGVIRCPRIAITYTTDSGQSRKFQVRLILDSDYEEVTRVLRALNCSLRDSPDRPNTAGTSISVPTPDGVGGFDVFTPSVEPERPNTAAPSTSFNQKPSSASLLRPATSHQQTTEGWASKDPAPRFRIHDRAQYVETERNRYDYDKPFALSQPENSYSDRYPDLQTPDSIRQPVFSSTAPQQLNVDFAASPDKSRPTSAPFPCALEPASYTLPPRRELPFGNPINSPSKEATGTKSGKSRLSSAMGHEDTTSTPKKVAKKRPGSSAANQTKKPAAPKKKQVSVSRDQAQAAGALDDTDSTAASQTTKSTAQKKKKQVIVTEDQAQITEKLDDRSVLTQLDPNASPTSKRPTSKSNTTDKLTREITESHANTIVSTESEQIATLRAYASTPSRERQTIIDDTISMYIGDDSFVTLCEDVENSWRRIGFETASSWKVGNT